MFIIYLVYLLADLNSYSHYYSYSTSVTVNYYCIMGYLDTSKARVVPHNRQSVLSG